MRWEPIHKSACQRADANLADYPRVWQEFSWERARGWLSGLPGGAGLNAGYEAVDRHATGARAGAVALRFRELGLPEGDTSTLEAAR
jgi:acetyl-CoA synthetase